MGDQSFVSSATRARIRGAVTPIALGAGKLGLTPNALTVIGFGIAAVAAATAAAQTLAPGRRPRHLRRLLRHAGRRARPRPEPRDPLRGLSRLHPGSLGRRGRLHRDRRRGLGRRFVAGAVLAAAAAVSSFQVSYTRAKAESLGLHGEVGIAPRAERLVLLTVGLVAAGLDGGIAAGARGQSWLGIGLAIIFVTASITAVQRTWHVRTQLRKEGP